MKKTVYYTALLNGPLAIGKSAHVITVNHPDKGIDNGRPLHTSPVVAIDVLEPHMFETENTIYQWVDLEQLQVRMESNGWDYHLMKNSYVGRLLG